MTQHIQLGELSIAVTRKDIKHVHLTVHPPNGRVTLAAPKHTRLEVARAYAISKLAWIHQQQSKLTQQARTPPRQLVNRESHHVWGRRYLMSVEYQTVKPHVILNHKQLRLIVRPASTLEKRAQVLHAWHMSLMHTVVPALIRTWEQRLNVQVKAYFLQKMKTKWGSCNPTAGHIRLNTELVKKPKDLLEYVVVHEMVHLIEPTHNERFIEILEQHFPNWREARMELNELPLADEAWQHAVGEVYKRNT